MSERTLERPAAAMTPVRRGRDRRGRTRLVTLGWQLLGVVVFLLAWQVAAQLIDYDAFLPPPGTVLADFVASSTDDPGLRYLGVRHPSYAANIGWTVGLSLLAWVVGGGLGAVVGLLSARVQVVRDVAEPVLFVFGAVPALVLAPFFLVWFGQGTVNKVVLVAFYCFVTVGLVAQSAALSFPTVSEEYAATMGLSTRQRFWRMVVPGTLPAVLAGLRIALATAIAVQATVELLGAQIGTGRLIALRATQGDVSGVLGLSIALGIAAVVLDALLRAAIRGVTRWQ